MFFSQTIARKPLVCYKAGDTMLPMKIASNRKAISQSMDLFIIIAAVLAVGGVVTAAVYGLANSAATSSTLQITQSVLVGGTSPSLTLVVKNTGTATIPSGIVTIALNVAGALGCTDSMTGSTTWSGACTGSAPLAWTGTASLAPGTQMSFAVTFSGTVPTISSGSQYSVVVSLGSTSASLKLTAQ